MKKIPQKIFLNPIMDILYLLRTTNNKKQKLLKKIQIQEINEVTLEIINLIDQKEKLASDAALGKVTAQVAHDIRSPASAILMLSNELSNLTDDQRAPLREAANRIQRIADNLLIQYGGQKDTFKMNKLLIAQPILSVITEEKMLHKNISFNYEFNKGASFAFVNIDRIEFERILTNVINNAAESIETNGVITIKLIVDDHFVHVKIIDNGKGIPEEIALNIRNGIKINSTKKNGFGLGWEYIRTTLAKVHAEFTINSKMNCGTEIDLSFSIEPAPVWLAKEIRLFPNDIIICLDDDTSMHAAWDRIFIEYTKQCPELIIKHFKNGEKCIEYIKALSEAEAKKVFILADYELNGQNLSGLDVIESVAIERSILVTSHYENSSIIKRAILDNVKILPKILAHDITYILIQQRIALPHQDVDLILIDDTHGLSNIIDYLYSTRGKKMLVYSDWYQLIYTLDSFNRSVKICFDYDLNCPITGVDLAEVFWKKGFKNLYLATEYRLDATKIPPYLILLKKKMDLLNL